MSVVLKEIGQEVSDNRGPQVAHVKRFGDVRRAELYDDLLTGSKMEFRRGGRLLGGRHFWLLLELQGMSVEFYSSNG